MLQRLILPIKHDPIHMHYLHGSIGQQCSLTWLLHHRMPNPMLSLPTLMQSLLQTGCRRHLLQKRFTARYISMGAQLFILTKFFVCFCRCICKSRSFGTEIALRNEF